MNNAATQAKDRNAAIGSEAEKDRSTTLDQKYLSNDADLGMLERLKCYFNEISFGYLFAPEQSETLVLTANPPVNEKHPDFQETHARIAANLVARALLNGARFR